MIFGIMPAICFALASPSKKELANDLVVSGTAISKNGKRIEAKDFYISPDEREHAARKASTSDHRRSK